LRLPPLTRDLEIDYTALSLVAPEKNQFRYKLEGHDRDWVSVGNRRQAFYTDLPPGNYRLRVVASNNSGVWNEQGASLDFTIAPAYWQTNWFRAACVAAFFLVLWALFQLRLRQIRHAFNARLEERVGERTRIARDLHDDLGSRTTRMVLLLDELALQNQIPSPDAAAHPAKISTVAREMIQSLDETVWAVNPRNDTLPRLVNYIGQSAMEFLNAAGARCRLDFPEPLPEKPISADVRYHLLLAVKEALHNAVRHGRATEVQLHVVADEESLVLEIADNGVGFESAPGNGSANGLRNMRQRMEEIGGKFEIKSELKTGTHVTLKFFWPRKC